PIELTPVSGNFTVPFATVFKASDARDVDGDALTFKIEAVLDGTLMINGSLFSSANCDFGPQSSLVWTPSAIVPSSGAAAFRVSAFDGFLRSDTKADVK